MKLFCCLNNLGYGDVINIDITDDDFIVSLEFNDKTVKHFSLNVAYAKTIYSSEELKTNDYNIVLNNLYTELISKKINNLEIDGDALRIIENGESILSMLKSEYGFSGLMHETTINNLICILDDGFIKPRKNLTYFDNCANKDVIEHTSEDVKKQVRFYFYKGTPTNYHFDKEKPNDMVYIAFNQHLLYLKGVKLFDGNASSIYSKSKLAIDYFGNPDDFMDWKSIFHRDPLPTDDECSLAFGFQEKNDIIRKRNAEVNIPHELSIKYIDNIIFKSKDSYDRFIKTLNNDIIASSIKEKIIINSDYFHRG